ncbi:GSCOCG00010797001-RA-CDS [Cotesia congregata]|uniref:Similar to F58A4.6: Uncharacterized protein F58A4.6 (Caenorhabditis elegans) n=1 Tax=Cotesia congregata TaxID=51543 RepID=A0A8J2E0T2_COTCN|nr:GSCOCG00010797001-RA-CDS [Cotesia congregata]CAG5073453.1 Similar to F58A4.6: Uncharacterized protein F58A4.6 (Caenorhabditis elegans) [Cotesia congregata]
MDVHLVIYSKKFIFDNLLISPNRVIDYQKSPRNDESSPIQSSTTIILVPMNTKGFSGYAGSGYVTLMKNSLLYRSSALKLYADLIPHEKIMNFTGIFLMKLKMPRKQFLDYIWNEIITSMVLERREISYAMSWLSTLGGAFSAMGDQFCHCAKIAGKISIHQFKLAMRLGDPSVIACCKLYVCLSLIQQEKYDWPKIIIPRIYKYSKTSKDENLGRMCQGIWAKLKYCYSLNKKKKKKLVYVS